MCVFQISVLTNWLEELKLHPRILTQKLMRKLYNLRLGYLAETLGCSFEHYFVPPDGERI